MHLGVSRDRPADADLPLVGRVRDTLRRYRMLSGGEIVVVAVSGGPDSTALAHALASLRGDLSLTIDLAHLNHGLRPDAAEDAAFVAAMSRALGLGFHEGTADPRALAGREGFSLEDAGRRLRYEFLTRVAREIGAGVVATGHTLDDQAETVLMRLLRGSGLEGLAGIPPVRTGGGVRIIRPLIEAGRAEVLAYLGAVGTGWREDETNRDVAMLRNRVRLVLLPALEGYNPDIRQALARLAGLLRDEAEALKLLAAPKVAEALSARPGAVTVALEPFARMPVALQRRTLRAAVQQVRGNLGAVRFVHIEGARRLALEGQVGSWLALPGGVRILRLPEGAEVTMAAAVPGGPGKPGEYRVHVPGRIVAVEFGVQLTVEEAAEDRLGAWAQGENAQRNEVALDAASIGGELVLRGPRPGDRFAPAGMGGRTKAVADYLSDEKVPRHRRAFVPILTTSEGEVLWIVGMRASEVARITDSTTRAVRVVARPLRA